MLLLILSAPMALMAKDTVLNSEDGGYAAPGGQIKTGLAAEKGVPPYSRFAINPDLPWLETGTLGESSRPVGGAPDDQPGISPPATSPGDAASYICTPSGFGQQSRCFVPPAGEEAAAAPNE